MPGILKFGNELNSRSSIGHVMYNVLSALLLAEYCNCTFLHEPFECDSKRFENIFNLTVLYNTISTKENLTIIPAPNLNFAHNPNTCTDEQGYFNVQQFYNLVTSQPDNTIMQLQVGKQFPGILIERSEYLCEILQKCYWSNKTPYQFGKKSIAIHIRRGDIHSIKNHDRWKPNSHYRTIIDKIKKKYTDIEVYIISEGNPDDFIEFQSDCKLVLNGSDIDALHMLASADILVTGQSTYSTILSYINKGIIIYTPCLNFTRFEKFKHPRFIHYKNIETQL